MNASFATNGEHDAERPVLDGRERRGLFPVMCSTPRGRDRMGVARTILEGARLVILDKSPAGLVTPCNLSLLARTHRCHSEAPLVIAHP